MNTRRTSLAGGALLAAAFLLLVLPRLGLAPIERAEIYFLDAARTMAESGDWLVPRYQGQAFFDKPALSYWLMAGAFRVFGFSLGPARAVSALAAAGCLALTMTLGTLLFSRRAGLVAAAVLATTIGFLSFARLAMSDMLLCLFVLAAATCGAAWLSRPQSRWWLSPAVGASLGLGVPRQGSGGAGVCRLRARRVRLAGPGDGARRSLRTGARRRGSVRVHRLELVRGLVVA